MINDYIEEYNAALAVVNKEREELAQIVRVELPAANLQVQMARGCYDGACLRMKSCTNMREMTSLQSEASNAKQTLDMANQLVTNLGNRANQLRANESNARNELKSALQKLWTAKSNQILDDINIPSEELAKLEQAIAARNLASLGYSSLVMSDFLKEKLGKVDLERLKDVKNQLMQELGVESPSIQLY